LRAKFKLPMIELNSVQVKIGSATRLFYFRPQSSDVGVIRQIFQDQDYELRRLRRYSEIVQFIRCSKTGSKKPLIVDAGANIGASSLYFKWKWPDALVVAIEPEDNNFRILEENIRGLDIVPVHAAVASAKTRVQVIDVGEGFWGYQTRALHDHERGGVVTTTINEIHQRYEATHFPFLVKIDIEGGEKELFSGNLEWVERTPLIIIELHDWLLGGQNTSMPFLQCVGRLNRDFVYIGENIFSIANNLDGLLAQAIAQGPETNATSRSPPRSKSELTGSHKAKNALIETKSTVEVPAEVGGRSRPLHDTPQEIESEISLLPEADNELRWDPKSIRATLADGEGRPEQHVRAMALGDEHSEALQVGIPGDAKRPRKLMGTADKVILRLQQEISSNLENQSKLDLEKDQLRAALGEAQAETVKLSLEVEQLRVLLTEKEAEAVLLRAAADASTQQAMHLRDQTAQAMWRSRHAANARKTKLEQAIKVNRATFERELAQLRDQVAELDAEASSLIPLLARLSRKFLGPIWRRPAISRIPLIADTPATPPGLESQTEQTQAPQLGPVAAFESLQNKLGRDVVLVAADAPPMFDKHAGGLRLHNLVRLFCELNRRVIFASRFTQDYFTGMAGSPEHRKRYEDLLYDAGVEQIAYGPEEGLNLIRMWGSELRWAFLSFPETAEQFTPLVRLHAPWADVIYDMVDFHALRMSREAELKSDVALRAAAERMRDMELTSAKTADLVVAVSEAERKALLQADPNLAVEVIPTVFDMPSDVRLEIDQRSGLLFVGGFWHTPNVDAVLWFAREIWPLVLRERPDMIFRIVGSNAPEQVLDLRGRPGIEVLGYVPDLTDLFAYSRMSVGPLSYGAGVKGKIGQSMAYGLPVVTTSIGAEGMALEHGKHLLIADAAEEFAAAVLRLASDDDLWRRLQANGRRFIEETQSMAAVRGKLRALMDG
jgi:O-antigen biosynthesis protein